MLYSQYSNNIQLKKKTILQFFIILKFFNPLQKNVKNKQAWFLSCNMQ